MSQLTCLFVCLLALFFIAHIKECNSHYADHLAQNRMRRRFYEIFRENIKDATQKVKSCQAIREFYAKSPSFFVAESIFVIRRRFARMMRLYINTYDVYAEHSFYDFKLEFYSANMIEIQRMGMDIDHMVEILTEWEEVAHKKVINIAGFMLSKDMLSIGPGGKLTGSLMRPGMVLPGLVTPPPRRLPGFSAAGTTKWGDTPEPTLPELMLEGVGSKPERRSQYDVPWPLSANVTGYKEVRGGFGWV